MGSSPICQIRASAEFKVGSLGLAQRWVVLFLFFIFFLSLLCRSNENLRTSPVSVHAVAMFRKMTEMNMINENEFGKMQV